jgi:hypothetical protein
MGLPLTTTQLAQIITYGEARNYPAMYNYIYQQMQSGAIAGTTAQQMYWFQQAANINANNGSYSSVFIRSMTLHGLAANGQPTTQAHIQLISNTIGANVLKDIKVNGVIPGLDAQINTDISAAIKEGGMSIGGWGGAFYYWNAAYTPPGGTQTTVGNAIMSSPSEFNKFINGCAVAIADVYAQFGTSFLNSPEFINAFKQVLLNLGTSPTFGAVGLVILGATATELMVRFGVPNGLQLMKDLYNAIGYNTILGDATGLENLGNLAISQFNITVAGNGQTQAEIDFRNAMNAASTQINAFLAGKNTTGAQVFKLPDGTSAGAVVILLANGESITVNSSGQTATRTKQVDDHGNTLWTNKGFDNSYSTTLVGTDGSVDSRNYDANSQLLGRTYSFTESDGSKTTNLYNAQNKLTTSNNVVTYDDGSKLETNKIYDPTTGAVVGSQLISRNPPLQGQEVGSISSIQTTSKDPITGNVTVTNDNKDTGVLTSSTKAPSGQEIDGSRLVTNPNTGDITGTQWTYASGGIKLIENVHIDSFDDGTGIKYVTSVTGVTTATPIDTATGAATGSAVAINLPANGTETNLVNLQTTTGVASKVFDTTNATSGVNDSGNTLISKSGYTVSANYSLLGDVNTAGGAASVATTITADGIRPGNNNFGTGGLGLTTGGGIGLVVNVYNTTGSGSGCTTVSACYSLAGNIVSTGSTGIRLRWPTDPLILDLDGGGVTLTSFGSSPVMFDVDNDRNSTGQRTQEQTGWMGAGEGMVVQDLDGNGKIDGINETLSEYYNGSAGQAGSGMAGSKPFANGFAALKSLDSNGDNQFTSSDAAWNSLRVWTDTNHDGVTDAGELKTFAQLNITSINLASTNQSGLVSGGNEVLATGTFTQTVGGTSQTKEALAASFIANPAGSTVTQSLLGGVTGYTVTTDNLNANGSLNTTITNIKSYVSGNTNANISESLNVTTLGVRHITGGAAVAVSSPKAAQTFGVRPQKKTKHCKVPITVQRGLTPIGLRQCANRLNVLAARPSGISLASHACLQAANDVACRLAA